MGTNHVEEEESKDKLSIAWDSVVSCARRQRGTFESSCLNGVGSHLNTLFLAEQSQLVLTEVILSKQRKHSASNAGWGLLNATLSLVSAKAHKAVFVVVCQGNDARAGLRVQHKVLV